MAPDRIIALPAVRRVDRDIHRMVIRPRTRNHGCCWFGLDSAYPATAGIEQACASSRAINQALRLTLQFSYLTGSKCNQILGLWRKRVRVELTTRLAESRIAGF